MPIVRFSKSSRRSPSATWRRRPIRPLSRVAWNRRGHQAPGAAPVLNQQTNDDARMALEQLSGEVYASVQSAMLESSHLARDAVSDRLTDLFTCPSNRATDTDNRTNAATPGVTGCGTSADHPMGWARAYGHR